MEDTFEHFVVFGGVEELIDIFLASTLKESIQLNLLERFSSFDALISPSFLKKSPFRNFMIAMARSDGKRLNIYRRARLKEHVGRSVEAELLELDLVSIQESREAPLRRYPKQKIKKALRGYIIQPKIRFREPFYNFWFGFIEPFRFDIVAGNYERFFEYFQKHFSKATSLLFEQLANEVIKREYDTLSSGNYWDKHSEFDILCLTKEGKKILGECKYKNKKICKNELSKLEYKAKQSNIAVDTFVLFSKNGFSNELYKSKIPNLKLYDMSGLKMLLD
jgi:hypothetical protein